MMVRRRHHNATTITYDRDRALAAFEALADQVQIRDGCDRMTALQTAIDENPRAFQPYERAMER